MDGKSQDIEQRVMGIIMADTVETKKRLAKRIFDIAYKRGIFPASINEFYKNNTYVLPDPQPQ